MTVVGSSLVCVSRDLPHSRCFQGIKAAASSACANSRKNSLITFPSCSIGLVVLGSESFSVALVWKLVTTVVLLSLSGVVERRSSLCTLRHALRFVDLSFTCLYFFLEFSSVMSWISSLLSSEEESRILALVLVVVAVEVLSLVDDESADLVVSDLLFLVRALLVASLSAAATSLALRLPLVLFAMLFVACLYWLCWLFLQLLVLLVN